MIENVFGGLRHGRTLAVDAFAGAGARALADAAARWFTPAARSCGSSGSVFHGALAIPQTGLLIARSMSRAKIAKPS